MIITFFGHADFRWNTDDEKALLLLLEERIGNAPCDFYLGEYGSFDRFAYRCAKLFQRQHPHAKLVFVTPYLPRLNQSEKKAELAARFDLILYPPLENVPARYAISHRNRWMVEQATLVIAFVCHQWGGAYTAYRYALRRNKEVYNLAYQGAPI